jgi:hypothetical protein
MQLSSILFINCFRQAGDSQNNVGVILKTKLQKHSPLVCGNAKTQ